MTEPPTLETAEHVRCAELPEPPGATWSNALRVGDELYISGVTAHPACRAQAMDAHVQALECLRKIETLARAAGGTLDQVVKLVVYLTDMADKEAVGRARRETFTPPYPASTLVGVRELVFPEVRVEIDATIRLDARRGGAQTRQSTP
jgi:enamine deaminase RidA (YjgF/YER057c/UK114 family)